VVASVRANGRPNDFRDTRAWRRLRAEVLLRDGGVCWICGGWGADTADHVIPVSLGGRIADSTNLRAAHRRCNVQRGPRGGQPFPLEQRRRVVLNCSRDW
jgi:5-methylcytosine-specific restriction endonuclease McrA